MSEPPGAERYTIAFARDRFLSARSTISLEDEGGGVSAVLLFACAHPSEAPALAVKTDCGAFRKGPALRDQREDSPSFLLSNDRVLVVGGHYKYVGAGVPQNTSEIVDVATNTSTLTGSFNTSRNNSGTGATVALPDGRFFTASSFNSDTEPKVPSEIYDPSRGRWTDAGTMNVGGGPGVVLPDGRVLVAGGIDWNIDTPIARTEIWERGVWKTLAPMTTPRTGHRLLLAKGKPIAIGGFAKYPDGPGVATSEIFDGAAWGAVAKMTAPRSGSSVVLRDGRILAVGGANESGGYKEMLSSAELYDPATNVWRATGAMHEARARFSLTLLADGRVLAAGGGYDAAVSATAEIFDPATETWTLTANMIEARGGQHAVLLSNGDVLIVGGYPASYTSEIYRPCVSPSANP